MKTALIAGLLFVAPAIPAMASTGASASVVALSPADGISTGFTPPQLIHKDGVVLPENIVLGQLPRADKKVVLSVNLSSEGYPSAIRVIRSAYPMMDIPVMQAVEEFHFSPARLDHRDIPSHVRLIVRVHS